METPELKSSCIGGDLIATEQSAFFVLNIREERLPGRIEWRGELLHVDSGVTISFEDWPDMIDLIASAIAQSQPEATRESMGKGAPSPGGHSHVGTISEK